MASEASRLQLEQAVRVAEQAAVEAGTYARERFGGRLTIKQKGDAGDMVTEVDLHTDALIVERIRTAFPEHSIESEEAGQTGERHPDRVQWHVDPLDGTNNYALGIPLYGVSIAAHERDEVQLGVVYDSNQGDLYTARAGGGATRNGMPIAARPAAEWRKATISWIQGHGVGKADELCLHLRHTLESRIKRVLRVWAPSLTWAMLARGDIQGIVLYKSEGCDLYAGLLLAQEAGALVTDFQGRPVQGLCGPEPYLVAAHPDCHDELLRLVQEAVADVSNP
ncbi:inositol monophosphatase family protein [Paenibacillus koleovorans]|uniref:inositol monophosphatase family protein n=1 Tax=Paenibacillus koleovorans TaxID=121608 RepID=UPI000FD8F9BD|nr:inositol monophosphatase [Paenibacillus koleovorans]